MVQPGHIERTVTIASAASLSDGAHIGYGNPDGASRGTLVAIVMPAAWTAADLTFQASNDNTTFTDLYSASGTEYTASAAADRWIAFDPADFAGVTHLKVRSGTSSVPVTQAANRVLTLIVRTVA